ncbi:hypothetical protein CC86DRAFT_196232 [Ophiobolus disseminans]|uniref:Uncharacterized protein n=1 Tax=Ophiobolus disseminans TaxID=1469910 RepID=A0A6A7A653_9PLEO|nr:hypothetical protein CC86DRAFT_196232 [Ophiobolus disseminans]
MQSFQIRKHTHGNEVEVHPLSAQLAITDQGIHRRKRVRFLEPERPTSAADAFRSEQMKYLHASSSSRDVERAYSLLRKTRLQAWRYMTASRTSLQSHLYIDCLLSDVLPCWCVVLPSQHSSHRFYTDAGQLRAVRIKLCTSKDWRRYTKCKIDFSPQ